MKRIKLALLVLICTGVLLHSQTEVTGIINNSTTWTTAGSPYIVLGDVVVPENVTLTIQAGVVVKFSGFWDNLVIHGTLNSAGTAGSQIIYTSAADDAHGGDSNGDGNATSPGPNQWSSVFISNTGSANFEHCWFGYGGGEHSGLIDIYSNDVIISDCSFNNSGQHGIYFEDASPTIFWSAFNNNNSHGIYINRPSDQLEVYLNENTFNANDWAIYADYRDNDSDIFLIDNIATNCNRNGFGINGSMVGENNFFGQSDFPFVVNGDLTIQENARLEISAGTVFKFNGFWDNLVCHGYLEAVGSQSNPVVFTSVLDDDHGGDTNNDLDQSMPAGNQWSSVYISGTGSADFNYCWFGYGGGEHSGLIDIYSNDVFISDCSFNNSGQHGIYFEDASPTIFWSAFNNNNSHGIYINRPSDQLEVYLNENTFNANDWAIYADYRDNNADIFLIDNMATNCNRNGFGINGSIVGDNNFFGQNDFPFVVNGDLNIQENARLDISEGTVVKFNGFWDNLVCYGHLEAIGSQTDPIVFTSVQDDEHGGDTNNDLDQSLPAGNQWASVYVSPNGSANFDQTWFGFGGGEHLGLLDVHTDDVTISNSSFNNSGDRGVYVQDASLHIYNSQFENNTRAGILFSGTSDNKDIILENNTFKANEWAAYADYKDNNASIILNNNLAENCGWNGFGINGSTSGSVLFDGQEDFAIVGNGDLTVIQGAELSITPGTLMKFNGFWDNLVVHGKLNALGDDFEPIVFTSIHDDEFGGDSNNNLDETLPEPNQWSSIYISNTGEADFEFCWFRYGGGEHSGIVDTYTSDVDFTHCSFFYSGENGIYANNSSFKVENCNFYMNREKGIHFEGVDGTKPVEIINTAFTDSKWAAYANLNGDTLDLNLDRSLPQGTTESGFARNGFGLAGNLSGDSKITGHDEFPLIIWETLTVNTGSSLELSPGTVVKFNDFWDHIVVNGSFRAEGTPQDHIYFTSLNDDCIGGDTNGDGATTEAGPDQWASVWISDQSTYASISYAEFYYGAGASNSMLTVDNDAIIEKSIFGNTIQNGIEFRSGSSDITNSIIHDNASGIAVTGDATVNISDCVFNHNTNWGVWAESQLDCGENYWGASTGPSNANSNPNGTGDRINDNVNCNQWLQNLPDQDLIEYPVFEATVYGKEVSLTNLSNSGSDFRWFINGSDTSTIFSPFFSLPEPGDYNICLQGTMNCHTVLTNCMTIPIKGISSYEPHVGGNSGTVSLSIAAGDPSNIEAVVLQTDAGNIIEAFNITKTGSGKLSASFNLDGQVPDQSELIVIYNNGEEYIADNSFMIELGEKSDPWLEITGHDAALLNTWSSYDIHFGNRSNVDAYGVPLWIAVSSVPDLEIDFVNVEFTQSQYSIDMGRTEEYFKDVDIHVDLDSMFGEANPTRVYPLYLQMIPANQDFTIKLRIKSSQNYELEAWLNEPYFNSPFNGRFALCVANIIAGKFIQFIPGAECANTVIGSIFKPTARLQGDNESILVVPSTHDMFNIMVDCGGSFFAGLKFAQNVINLVLNFKNDVQALIDCKKNFDPKDKKKKDVNIVQSFDPNEKVGPAGYGESNYIGYQEEINYTIFFENKSDASAPAHTIIVRDTLDQTVFDLASIQLKAVSLGDDVFSLNPNSKTYAAQHLLDELGVVAQVEASIDESNGVMEWKFRSIEPSTGEEITDPFVGILPPNILSPEGEGYVSFTVSLVNPPSHDFEFGNRASIYFDANDPIHTEAYINTFDLEEPESWIDIAEDLIINSNIIELEVNAMDDGAGVDNVEIWYAVNDEAFQLWQIISPDITTIEFTGEQGNEYSFYSVAKDYVGLYEGVPGVPDASTMISNTDAVDGLFSEFKIYPQPSDGIIYIQGEGFDSGPYTIRIYNSIGQVIHNSMELSNHDRIDLRLDLSGHPGGVYILNINKDELSLARQFIIE